MSEELLIRHCAPTLAGLKTGSLFVCAFESNASMVAGFDALAFGCSAQGAEVLEEYEFEPMFADCEKALPGKKVALFGSYDWGDGEWMRSWEARCAAAGIKLACDCLIINNTPDAEGEAKCKDFGAALAK